ncbi:hypothetical protein [Psychroflexus aestuariivivens]|uniref:hypothetical protein n=1 Tax=Psychroflexus aestuariivivens TaxID=1795040 RepID=UPI000FDADCAF|nr:hypothetical protein [Psychroflexus aestuariivivens]
MKNLGFIFLAITTLVLITVTIFASLNLSFSWVFYLSILGQILLVISVYKILREDYQTDKEFKDWYEDHPKSDKD